MDNVKIEILSDSEGEPEAGPSAGRQQAGWCGPEPERGSPEGGSPLLSALTSRVVSTSVKQNDTQQTTARRSQKQHMCSVKYCRHTSRNKPDMAFFPLPKSSDSRIAIWKRNIQPKRHRNNIVVCQAHFKKYYLVRSGGECRLTANAVPTLNLPKDRQSAKNHKQATKTTDEPQVKRKQNRDYLLQIIGQQETFRKKNKGEKYTDAFKFEALQLYFTSPSTYRVVQTFMNFPSISVLNRLYIPAISNVRHNVISALKRKVKYMNESERKCCVCIGSLQLKKHLYYDVNKDLIIGLHDVNSIQKQEFADTALVVTVRGIFDEWCQAVLVTYLAQQQDYSDVRKLIMDTTLQLFDIGLNVCAMISDIDSDFIGIVQHYKITVNEPHFTLNERIIYFMYDTDHLLKALRDDFSTHDIHWSDKVAKWQHIKDCYNYDKKKTLRLAPNLTFEHIVPPADLHTYKTKLQLAKDALSLATATAISAYVDSQLIDQSAKDTIEWIVLINNAFDLMKPGRNTENKSYDGSVLNNKFLDFVLNTLQNLRLVDNISGTDNGIKHSPFVNRMQLTIVALKSLHNKVLAHLKTFKYLDSDCVGVFFHKVQKKYSVLPTAQQVEATVNTLPISNLFHYKLNRKSVNLAKFSQIVNDKMDFNTMCSNNGSDAMAAEKASKLIDLNSVELDSDSTMSFLVAFLLYEGLRQHKGCQAMQNYVFDINDCTSDNTVVLKKKITRKAASNAFVLVRKEFMEFIESMEVIFKLYFETESNQRRPLEGLKQYLLADSVTFQMPCECFPIDFIKLLFIRCRLHIFIKYINENLLTDDDSIFCFTVNKLK